MGKTSDIFKKIGDTNGIFHAKMDSANNGNVKDLTAVEEIKKTWQEHTEHYTKKFLMSQITTTVCSFT